jgi:hypothetical protein
VRDARTTEVDTTLRRPGAGAGKHHRPPSI